MYDKNHGGKGWGFQAGVLKGDFAHSCLGVFAFLPIIVGMIANTPDQGAFKIHT